MLQVGVKFIRLGDALGKNCVEIVERLQLALGLWRLARHDGRGGGALQAQFDFTRAAGGNFQFVMRAHFCAGALGVHNVLMAANQIFVERVFEKAVFVLIAAEAAVGVRFVFREQQFRQNSSAVNRTGEKFKHPQFLVLHLDRRAAAQCAQTGLVMFLVPRPGVAKPKMRQDVDGRGFRPAIVNGDAHQNVIWRGLGVFDKDVEVTVVVKNARV